jgi:hypothetical protein
MSGQGINHDLDNKWSASISFSPITTLFYYHPHDEYLDYYSKGVSEYIYPYGLNFEMTRQLNNRLSVNSGLNFKARPGENLINIIGEWTSSYYEKSTDNRYVFEVPVNIKFKLLLSSRVLDPYIKTGLRGSYFKRYYVGEFTRWDFEGTTNGEIDNHDVKLIIFYEIGVGSYLNLSKSIAFVIGSNLTYTFSGFGYLEFQTGLNYSF